jgi:signal transduction histidine kinase
VFSLETSIAALTGMIERLFGPEIAIHAAAAPDLPPILGDPGQIEQALFNLATNARDAMPEGGTITFDVSQAEVSEAFAAKHRELKPGAYVAVRVSDTGHGMPADVLSRIFDPFFTTKEVGQGTGLGLAITYGIVQDHGGTIAAANGRDGGAVFSIELPSSGRSVGGKVTADFPTE